MPSGGGGGGVNVCEILRSKCAFTREIIIFLKNIFFGKFQNFIFFQKIKFSNFKKEIDLQIDSCILDPKSAPPKERGQRAVLRCPTGGSPGDVYRVSIQKYFLGSKRFSETCRGQMKRPKDSFQSIERFLKSTLHRETDVRNFAVCGEMRNCRNCAEQCRADGDTVNQLS